jgi:hypothetical protein
MQDCPAVEAIDAKAGLPAAPSFLGDAEQDRRRAARDAGVVRASISSQVAAAGTPVASLMTLVISSFGSGGAAFAGMTQTSSAAAAETIC